MKVAAIIAATPCLRFAEWERSVIHGSFWGIPANFAVFAAISITTTVRTVVVFGEAIPTLL